MYKIEQVLTSMEVADMVKKTHKDLLRNIRIYIQQMTERKIAPSEFFKESEYKDSTGRVLPCYLITKKGCEFIAHKLTGQKGTEFMASYINRFHDMQTALEQKEERSEIAEIKKEMKEQRKMLNKLMSGMQPLPRIEISSRRSSENEAYRSEIIRAIEQRNDKEYLMGVYSFAITYLHQIEV